MKSKNFAELDYHTTKEDMLLSSEIKRNVKDANDLILNYDDKEIGNFIKVITFDFREVDTNLILMNNFKNAYDSAITSKRLYEFGGKEDFLLRYNNFIKDLVIINSILSKVGIENKYYFIDLLEFQISQNTDKNYTLKELKNMVVEITGFGYYKTIT